MTTAALAPVPSLDPALRDALREDLTAAPYTVDAVNSLLSASARRALERENPIPAQRELDTLVAQGPASKHFATALLTRVFTLGGTATNAQLDAALPTLTADGATRMGLVQPTLTDDHTPVFCAAFDLRPYAATDNDGDINWWFVSDLGELATGRALEGEHVLGIGGATSTLISITPRRPVDTALDLGCGCGIQALHVARHARHTLATDISERALALTEFNVALNAPTLPPGHTIETRQGSMLEPVAGEKFDLIVSNPPFVITPRETGHENWTYRDGGREGDAIVRDLVENLHRHLTPGGTAVMLANWEITGEEPWQARPEQWLRESPAHAIVIEREEEDPAGYAATWLRDGGVTERDPRWVPLTHAWLDDFASRNTAAIGFGHVVMRMPSAENTHESSPVHVFEKITTTGTGPLGPRYLEMLEAMETLSGLSDDELRATTIARAEDVVERRHFIPGAEDPMLIEAVQGGGFGRIMQLDTHTAGILGVLTGEYPLGALLDAYDALLTQSSVEENTEEENTDIMQRIRELILWGFARVVR